MEVKNIKILLFSLIMLLAEIVVFGQKDSSDLKRLNERRLTKKVLNQYCNYENLTYKIDAKINTSKKKYNLNIVYRNIKDSVIWMNINHNTGIPVARFLVTRDSTKFINRIDKKFMVISNENMANRFDYDISFDMLQAIFSAQLLNLEDEKDLVQAYSHYRVYADSAMYIMQNINKKRIGRLVRKNKLDDYFIHQVKIDSDFFIRSTSLEDHAKFQKITFDYPDYYEGTRCPEKIEMQLINQSDTTDIELKIKKVKLNEEEISTSFSIPEKYEEMLMPKATPVNQ